MLMTTLTATLARIRLYSLRTADPGFGVGQQSSMMARMSLTLGAALIMTAAQLSRASEGQTDNSRTNVQHVLSLDALRNALPEQVGGRWTRHDSWLAGEWQNAHGKWDLRYSIIPNPGTDESGRAKAEEFCTRHSFRQRVLAENDRYILILTGTAGDEFGKILAVCGLRGLDQSANTPDGAESHPTGKDLKRFVVENCGLRWNGNRLEKAAQEHARPAAGSDAVRATLEPSTNQSGVFTIHVTNISSNTIRFLDIREGTGWCGEFYEVTVEKDGETNESKGNCLYAPADVPAVVELGPGQTYDRDIQPVAYVRSEKHLTPPCTIMVTYRLTDKIKSQWRKMKDDLDIDLVFRTEKVEIRAWNQSPECTR